MTPVPAASPPGRFDAAGLVLACAGVAALAWAVMSPEALLRLMDETGPIEHATALLYFLGAAWVLVAGVPQTERPLRLPLGVLLCGFGARELDLHKAFSGLSVLKGSFYLGDAPWAHKLAALAAVLPVLAAIVVLLLRYTAPVWRGLRRGQAGAVTVAVFVATLVVSKILDRSRMVLLEDYGVDVGVSVSALLVALEESLELALPLIVMAALLRRRRAAAALSQPRTP